MTPATKTLLEALIRLGKGALDACDKWVKAAASDFDLGFGWRCPYCGVSQDEGQKTGVYWHTYPVCGTCAPKISAMRKAHEREQSRPVAQN